MMGNKNIYPPPGLPRWFNGFCAARRVPRRGAEIAENLRAHSASSAPLGGNAFARWRLVVLFLLLPTIASAQTQQRPIAQDVGLDQHLEQQLDLSLTFTDEDGRRVQLREYFGKKPVILTCVYYRCPMLCTEVLTGVLKSTNAMRLELGKDYEILSISIDPKESTQLAADKKSTYVRSYRRPGGDQGWHFLTGEQAAITTLTRSVGFRYRYDAASDQFAHASGIMVLTPEGKISRYFYGIDYPPRDLQLALVESSENRIGSLVDQVLLLCFHYDPVTGRYGLVISNVLRLASLATLLVLGTYLGRMYLLERRRSQAAAQERELQHWQTLQER